MKMLCLGPQGTNGHEAALIAIKRIKDMYPGFEDTEFDVVFAKRNVDVLELFEKEASFGVVPIENSTEGLVSEVVKGWYRQEKQRTHIIGEIHLPIIHNLLVRPEVESVGHIMEVISHPQALGQCSNNLDRLELMKRVPSTSTAEAASRISMSSNLRTSAAIASKFAAHIWKLTPIIEGLEDIKGNTTRFHILSLHPVTPLTGKDRTAVIFRVKNEPQALQKALEPIGVVKVNMSSIHSIPLGVPGFYGFYCEFDCHVNSEVGELVLQRMRDATEFLWVLGSYPQSLPEKGGVS